MSKNDGGPAFPVTDNGDRTAPHCGMSLRDWFAGMSLSRLVNERERTPDKVAELAYGIADAMLIARESN